MEHEEMRATVYTFPRAFPFCEIKKEREKEHKITEKRQHEKEKNSWGNMRG